VFKWMLAEYEASLSWALRHPRLMMLLLAATIGLNVFLYIVIPKGFFPQQDTGRMIGSIQADQGISFQAMRQKLADFIEIVRSDPAVENVVGFTGGGQRNSGFMFLSLKPLNERKVSADQVVARLRPRLAQNPARACSWFRFRTSASAAGRRTRSTSSPCRPTICPTCVPGSRACGRRCPTFPSSPT